MYWWIAGSLIAFTALVTHTVGQYGSHCKLPDQQGGLCMPVHSCKSIYEIFLKIHASGGHVSKEHQDLFSKLHCGSFNNQPHVCCNESDIQFNPVGLDILKNQTCGTYTVDKVSNAKEAALFAFPWMALLVYNESRHPYRCAGSIISEQYVLTAAHCIVGIKGLDHVRLGEHNLSSEIDCTAGGRICAPAVLNIGIEETIVHEEYLKYNSDIALIRLQRKVEYHKQLQPLCLPIFDYLKESVLEEYIISGWGRTEKELYANVLMAAVVPHVPRPECQKTLEKYKLRIELTESIICAGNSMLVDVCVGDSGGPMGFTVPYEGRPRYVQFGVVSFGVYFCGDANAPNAYTNVSHYMQWITDHMRN